MKRGMTPMRPSGLKIQLAWDVTVMKDSEIEGLLSSQPVTLPSTSRRSDGRLPSKPSVMPGQRRPASSNLTRGTSSRDQAPNQEGGWCGAAYHDRTAWAAIAGRCGRSAVSDWLKKGSRLVFCSTMGNIISKKPVTPEMTTVPVESTPSRQAP